MQSTGLDGDHLLTRIYIIWHVTLRLDANVRYTNKGVCSGLFLYTIRDKAVLVVWNCIIKVFLCLPNISMGTETIECWNIVHLAHLNRRVYHSSSSGLCKGWNIVISREDFRNTGNYDAIVAEKRRPAKV